MKRVVIGFCIALACFAAYADVSAEWRSIAAHTIRNARASPDASERDLAIVMHAMAAAQRGANGQSNGSGRPSWAEGQDAAVAVAAFAVLEALYPDQREDLESRLAITFSHIPETAAKAEGASLGRRTAQEALRARR